MIAKPRIPMHPAALPQQRLVMLARLPERPQPFDSVIGWHEKPPGVDLPRGPRKAHCLGQLEWAWSPMHGAVNAYYLSRGRTHWILWIRSYDDNWGVWDWVAVGHVPLRQAGFHEAAVHLMADLWRFERSESDLDHFHWINEAGELDVGTWRALGFLLWPETAAARAERDVKGDQAGSGGSIAGDGGEDA